MKTIFNWARQAALYVFPALVLAVAAIYISSNFDQFRQLEISSWWWLAALVAGCLAQSLSSALVFKKLLAIFQVRLSFWEAAGLVFLTGIGNFLVPYVGGIGLRAAYLKKRYGFSLRYFASTVGGAALLTISINAVIGLLMVLYLLATRGVFSPAIFFIFLCCLLLPGMLILLPPCEIKSKNWILQKISRIWEGWGMISRHRGDIAVLAWFTFLTAFFGILTLHCAFRVVNDSILFVDAVIVSAMTALSALVNVTPSGLGISDLVIFFTSRALGHLAVIGVSVALIWRGVSTAIIFAGGGIASYLLPRASIKDSRAASGVAGSVGLTGGAESVPPPAGPQSSG